MTSIPNTQRRGAIYWYRKSRRLPCGNLIRPMVSLRTACPRAARRRAAILTARFEDLCMRLFGNPGSRLALEPDAATRIFQAEFHRALDAIEEERVHAQFSDYEFHDLDTFLDVHEEVYRVLAENDFSAGPPEGDADGAATCDLVASLARRQLSHMTAIWHQSLDETTEALSDQQIEPYIFNIDHAMRLRFEARLAAVHEYRRRMKEPGRRLTAPAFPPPPALPRITPEQFPSPASPHPLIAPTWATLTAEEAGQKFIAENPKLAASQGGRREAKWTTKTRAQFELAMRMLQKSVGPKPFVQLSNEDLRQLLKHFDGLPPNHHKSPRHGPMTLADICAEAQAQIAEGQLDKAALGLNVPTLNRHFRFLKMAHEWMRKQNPAVQALDWAALSFEDGRNARDQRDAFPVAVARKIFRLPPWHGCAGKRHRLKPGRDIYHDSLYWVFPLLWYSGMRREEACKLQVDDVKVGEAGIWYFDIRTTDAGRVKNASAVRCIPVCDELRRLGFIEFVAALRDAGEQLLFGELASATRTMGDSYYRLGWQKILPRIEAQALTLHGIRHTVADELKAAGVSEETRADLLGHTLESETAGRYSKGSRLPPLLDAVNRIPIVSKSVRPVPIRR